MPFDGADYTPWKGSRPEKPTAHSQELLEAAIMVGACFPLALCLIDTLHCVCYDGPLPSPIILMASAVSVVCFGGALGMRKRRIARSRGVGG